MSKNLGKDSRCSGDKLSVRISGNSLRVYWYLVINAGCSVGVRNVQRAMDFASPSTALYHLQKLRDLGVVEKDRHGNYSIKKFVKINALRNFLFIGNHLIPRHLIYAVITTAVLLAYSVLLRSFLSYPLVLVALLPNVISALIFWVETLMVWRSKPRFS